MAMIVTQAQLDKLYELYQRWQNRTPHPIMPVEFEIVSEEDYGTRYYGVWVDGPPNEGMFIGIEADGYAHT
jgi:hypothetical protein